jgi:hypothetical protein
LYQPSDPALEAQQETLRVAAESPRAALLLLTCPQSLVHAL